MSDSVETRFEGPVGVVTLNVPGRRNAISPEMRGEVICAMKGFAADPACRAIVLTGANGDFCAGGDLKEAQNGNNSPNPMKTRRNAMQLHEVIRLIAAGPLPVVAAVEGYAIGAGLSLAAAADFVVASRSARFCAAFAKVGLMADAGLLWSLPQRIGSVRARQLLFTARLVEAEEATDMGLIDELVDEGGALARAIERAAELSQLAPLSIAAMKAVMGRGPVPLDDVLTAEADMQPMLAMSLDYAEGRAAFKERRSPVFRGL